MSIIMIVERRIFFLIVHRDLCSPVFVYICSGKFDNDVPRLFIILINVIDVPCLLKRYICILVKLHDVLL